MSSVITQFGTRMRGKQKTADLHQAGGWCFQLETSFYPLPPITSEASCFASMAP